MRAALALLLLAVALAVAAAGAGREVALTIDDLPRGGDGGGRIFAEIRDMTERLLAPLHEQKIPVTGFVHPGRTELAVQLDDKRIVRATSIGWLWHARGGGKPGRLTYNH
jgi:hypothetical protein